MWRILPILAVLANLILIVTSAKDSHTIITVQNKAAAGSVAAVEAGNGTDTAIAGAAASASSTTVIKTGHHHHTRKCAVNEKYVKCPVKLCQPQVCDEVGFPQCSSHEEKYYHVRENKLDPDADIEEPCTGPPACVCKDNYVRNDDGVCVHVSTCPSCGNDKNSTFGCGVNCGRRCSNYDKGPVNCADTCYANSCDCKKEYVFDDYRGFCVLPEDCSNKDDPEPEGTEGTPGNGEGEDTSTNPCDDCDEVNCDPQDTTNPPDGGEKTCAAEAVDGEEGTEDSDNGDSSTPTTAGDSSSTTEESREESTPNNEDKDENMATSTQKAGSSEEPNTSSTESHMTTKENGSESTTKPPSMGTTSESASTAHVHKKKKRRTTTTTVSSGESGSSTEGSAMTTGLETKWTTEASKIHTTTEDSESLATTGSSSTHTHKKKKRLKTTTTKHSGMKTTAGHSGMEMTTEHSGMETTTGHSGIETTTGHSGMETTIGHSGMDTTTGHSGMETTTGNSGMETDFQTTTMKGPNDCKAKNEWWFLCAPACPQKTCSDYVNGVKCPKIIGIPKCKPECRCVIGFYKDEEGNCISSWECKKQAKSMAASSTNEDKDTTASSTTMMTTTPAPKCEDVAYDLFVVGNLRYTAKLLIDQSQRDPGNNILVGGASISFLLAQLALNAKDPTKTELLDAFNLKDLEQILCFFPKISAELTASYPDIDYSLFCKIYADIDYALTDDFIQKTTEIFVIGPENLNFSSSEAVQKINSDVAKATNDRFPNFIKRRTLKSLNSLVLTDAEEFQGIWEKQFNPKYTTLRDFFWQETVDKIPFMYRRGSMLYVESPQLNAKVLKMKYRGGRFTLAIILPNMSDGINDVLKRMENPQNIVSAFDSLKEQDVEVYLPKFEISVANRLKMSSKMANIKEIFNNGTTDLKAISSAEPPYVSDILQKMTFRVDEHGMGDKMDNAFPAEISNSANLGMKYQFKADHPFVFALLFDKIVLFFGIYQH